MRYSLSKKNNSLIDTKTWFQRNLILAKTKYTFATEGAKPVMFQALCLAPPEPYNFGLIFLKIFCPSGAKMTFET